MKIDMTWILAAKKALEESGIVQRGIYPKVFKGYISSLAASIVQSGLVPALSIYESDNDGNSGSAENNRAILIDAIVLTLNFKNRLGGKRVFPLSDYIARSSKNIVSIQRDINRSLVALKLAIRMYKPEADTDKEVRKNKVSKAETDKAAVVKILNEIPNSLEQSANLVLPNMGWLFYKDLYRSYKCYVYKQNGKDVTTLYEHTLFEQKLNALFQLRFKPFAKENKRILAMLGSQNIGRFDLVTTYPGLLSGTGLSHGVKDEADIKVGFQFDYTTGLPYIPGSSVKGVLRSVFPDSKKEQASEHNQQRIAFIRAALGDLKKTNPQLDFGDFKLDDDEMIWKLDSQLFDESASSVSRDIFMDALIVNAPANRPFIGPDYITPHKDALADPLPVQFIKVLPGVTFSFVFMLNSKSSQLSIDVRIELYKYILKHVGIGAKTNVGYGHLVEEDSK